MSLESEEPTFGSPDDPLLWKMIAIVSASSSLVNALSATRPASVEIQSSLSGRRASFASVEANGKAAEARSLMEEWKRRCVVPVALQS